MVQGDDVDHICLHAIDDPIVSLQHLAIGAGFVFQNEASRKRMDLQEFDAGQNLLCKSLRRNGCVVGNVVDQAFQIVNCFGSPDYLSHGSSRFFASSCGMP
jgi:hypothetical protein